MARWQPKSAPDAASCLDQEKQHATPVQSGSSDHKIPIEATTSTDPNAACQQPSIQLEPPAVYPEITYQDPGLNQRWPNRCNVGPGETTSTALQEQNESAAKIYPEICHTDGSQLNSLVSEIHPYSMLQDMTPSTPIPSSQNSGQSDSTVKVCNSNQQEGSTSCSEIADKGYQWASGGVWNSDISLHHSIAQRQTKLKDSAALLLQLRQLDGWLGMRTDPAVPGVAESIQSRLGQSDSNKTSLPCERPPETGTMPLLRLLLTASDNEHQYKQGALTAREGPHAQLGSGESLSRPLQTHRSHVFSTELPLSSYYTAGNGSQAMQELTSKNSSGHFEELYTGASVSPRSGWQSERKSARSHCPSPVTQIQPFSFDKRDITPAITRSMVSLIWLFLQWQSAYRVDNKIREQQYMRSWHNWPSCQKCSLFS